MSERNTYRLHFDNDGASLCNYTDHTHPPTLTTDWDLVDCKRCKDKAKTDGEDAELGPLDEGGSCRLCEGRAYWASGWYSGLCPDCAIHEAVKATLRIEPEAVAALRMTMLVDVAQQVVRASYHEQVSPALLERLEAALKEVVK